MVKVMGFYFWKNESYFNPEYYLNDHLELTKKVLTPVGAVKVELSMNLLGIAPRDGEIIAISNVYFNSKNEAEIALKSSGNILIDDLKNYTNLVPEIKIMSNFT